MAFLIFVVADIIGFAIGHYLFDGSTAVYVSILISYHFVLGLLIFLPDVRQQALSKDGVKVSFAVSSDRNQKGLSLPLGEAILSHLACLALVVGMPYLREHIPFFGLIRYVIPGMAFFEAEWLFSGGKKKPQVESGPAPVSGGTAEDHEQFLMYLAQPERRFSRPGRSVSEEQALWLADRMKQRAAYEDARRAAGMASQ